MSECFRCDESSIVDANGAVYYSKDTIEVFRFPLRSRINKVGRIGEDQPHPVSSIRYLKDVHFAMEAMIYHEVNNLDHVDAVKVTLQEYLPDYLEPYYAEVDLIPANIAFTLDISGSIMSVTFILPPGESALL